MQQDQSQTPNTYQTNNSQQPSGTGRRWLIIGAALLLIIVAVIGFAIFNATRNKDDSEDRQAAKPLTIGSKPYIYPCSVATREDFARIFKLDNETVGTVTERSALPLKYIKIGGDLTKLAPGSSPDAGLATGCAYTLAKKGATQVNRIDIELVQFANEEQAAEKLSQAHNLASGAYLQETAPPLPALQSFTKKESYFKKPDQGYLEAGFVMESRFVQLKYRVTDSETVGAVTPLLAAYAKTIKANLAANKENAPVDLTGHKTAVESKFIDICRHVDLKEMSRTFSNIEFRPDEMTDIAIYGSLPGSHAAADGIESDCLLNFNTPGDREAQAQLEKARESSSRPKDPLSASSRWQHNMTLSVNSFKNANEAKKAFDTKKARVQKPISGTTTDVKDVPNTGDGAYSLVRETDLSLERLGGGVDERLLKENSLVVLAGNDIIVVSIQQSTNSDEYQKVPVKIDLNQQKAGIKLIQNVLTQHRT